MGSFEEELKQIFLEEAKQLLDEAESDGLALTKGSYDKANLQKLFRIAHTFKGSARAAGFEFLSKLAHEFENVLDRIQKESVALDIASASVLLNGIDVFRESIEGLSRDLSFIPKGFDETLSRLKILASAEPSVQNLVEQKPQNLKDVSTPQATPPTEETHSNSVVSGASGSIETPRLEVANPIEKSKEKKEKVTPPLVGKDLIRISAQKLDRLIDLISELKVYRQLKLQSPSGSTQELDSRGGDFSSQVWGSDYIDKIITEAHDLSLALRMTPILPVFQKMERVVWDVGGALGKEIQFVTSGEEVELDKVIVDRIGDSLTHLIRNAVDHGLESAEERIKKGKPKAGTIKLSAQVEENRVLVTVSDDGFGLNRDRILQKGVEKGLVQSSKDLTDKEVFELIFEPGFSTRGEITELSGRGFGMDIVREALREMGGTIEIVTQLGVGTTFRLFLPLILSVIEGLVCEVDSKKYIISLSQVQETVDLGKQVIKYGPDGSAVFSLRGEVMPIVKLGNLLHGSQDGSRSVPPDGGVVPQREQRASGLIFNLGIKKIAFEVDRLVASQPLALRSLGAELQKIPGIKACGILNDGEPALVINLAELIPAGSIYGRW